MGATPNGRHEETEAGRTVYILLWNVSGVVALLLILEPVGARTARGEIRRHVDIEKR